MHVYMYTYMYVWVCIWLCVLCFVCFGLVLLCLLVAGGFGWYVIALLCALAVFMLWLCALLCFGRALLCAEHSAAINAKSRLCLLFCLVDLLRSLFILSFCVS